MRFSMWINVLGELLNNQFFCILCWLDFHKILVSNQFYPNLLSIQVVPFREWSGVMRGRADIDNSSFSLWFSGLFQPRQEQTGE